MEITDYQKHSLSLRNIKRSWKVCPRCQKIAVSKENRCCMACKGRLFWDGDDALFAISRQDGFWVWHKSVFGLCGWYEMSFFDISYPNP